MTDYDKEIENLKTYAIKKYNKARDNLDNAESFMICSFIRYKTFIADNEFEKAKEWLRPMPDSAVKVLAFREILIAEDCYKNEKG